LSSDYKLLREDSAVELSSIEISNEKREVLYDKYRDKIKVDPALNRTLVSFQANKREFFYRWFKYKEGFSKKLVRYFLKKYHPTPGIILDPFAGVGSTLFAAREMDWKTVGIELLPVGIYSFDMRLASERIDLDKFRKEIDKFNNDFAWDGSDSSDLIKHIPITKGAFPNEAEMHLNSFLLYCKKISDLNIKKLFEFSAFSILEEISYTRKDGQYLRWDYRANRSWGKTKFNKGKIYQFRLSILKKLNQIFQDLELGNGNGDDLFSETNNKKRKLPRPKMFNGSSLEKLPTFDNSSFDVIMTSPPYCNRYDYTRTYALELVYLGQSEKKVKNLRQNLLSCTVENKEKRSYLENLYTRLNKYNNFCKVSYIYDSNEAMGEVNNILNLLNNNKMLNNTNIPRMVKNYFFEMAFIIFEMHRIIRNGGYTIMVNDNVRYGGQEIPVDLILSDFAVKFGFEIERIWTLPVGKGNSSQQMGNHGRSELRKCVYVWRKPS
jgi:DNA modification methylase